MGINGCGSHNYLPENKLIDEQANLLGHVDITHLDVSVGPKVKMDNRDSNGQILMSTNNVKKLMFRILQRQQEQWHLQELQHVAL